MSSLPVNVATGVREAAENLRQVLQAASVRERPDTEETEVSQIARLLDRVADALQYSAIDPVERQAAQWVDVANMASHIADRALGNAGDKFTLAQAIANVRSNDSYITAVGVAYGRAVAFSGSVEITWVRDERDETDRNATVAIAADEGRTLTVTSRDSPPTRPAVHNPTTLLRTTHHLQRLGTALGAAIDGDGSNE